MMKTVNDYIQDGFRQRGIEVSWADLLKIEFYSTISGEGEMDVAYIPRIDVAIAKFIHSLFLQGNISEGGFSVSSAPKENVVLYYQSLCKQYGLRDELSNKPKVTFL